MKIWCFIFAFMLCHILFSENFDQQLMNDYPVEVSLMDTNGLDPKLKLFLDKFYQKNYSNYEYVKSIKSIQFIGSYELNGEKIGAVKIIKKRPNKYKSYIKKNDNSGQIIIFDGETLKSGQTIDSDPSIIWETLDLYAPENIWIHFEQLFDDIMLKPKDPNKDIILGIPFKEDGQVIQPVTIDLKNKIKITNFIPIRDNLTLRTIIEFNAPKDPEYLSATIYFENYEAINGIMFPRKITTKLREDLIITNEFSDIEFNLGISDFFFKEYSF